MKVDNDKVIQDKSPRNARVEKENWKDQAYVPPLTNNIQNNIGHTSGSSDLSSEHVQDQDKKSKMTLLLPS